MENESSLKGTVIMSLGDRKTVGRINDLVIDEDSLSIKDFVVVDSPANVIRLLPFDKIIAIGDTFATIESSDVFRKETDTDVQRIINKGFNLVDTEVFSKVGNKLGVVKSFEFSPIDGNIRDIVLTDGTKFNKDSFVFFSAEYVFVDDGSKTFEQLRLEGFSELDQEPAEVNEDRELMEYLVGKTTTSQIESLDGFFTIEAGTVLTEDVLAQAKQADVLTMLIMSVE